MKTINIIGVTILAPLAAAFFILTIGFKTIQAIGELCFYSQPAEVNSLSNSNDSVDLKAGASL